MIHAARSQMILKSYQLSCKCMTLLLQWQQLRQWWSAAHRELENVEPRVTHGQLACVRLARCRLASQTRHFHTSYSEMSAADSRPTSVSRCRRGGAAMPLVPAVSCARLPRTPRLPVSCVWSYSVSICPSFHFLMTDCDIILSHIVLESAYASSWRSSVIFGDCCDFQRTTDHRRYIRCRSCPARRFCEDIPAGAQTWTTAVGAVQCRVLDRFDQTLVSCRHSCNRDSTSNESGTSATCPTGDRRPTVAVPPSTYRASSQCQLHSVVTALLRQLMCWSSLVLSCTHPTGWARCLFRHHRSIPWLQYRHRLLCRLLWSSRASHCMLPLLDLSRACWLCLVVAVVPWCHRRRWSDILRRRPNTRGQLSCLRTLQQFCCHIALAGIHCLSCIISEIYWDIGRKW